MVAMVEARWGQRAAEEGVREVVVEDGRGRGLVTRAVGVVIRATGRGRGVGVARNGVRSIAGARC
jgi:ATP:corrinoid adenosyltransferase